MVVNNRLKFTKALRSGYLHCSDWENSRNTSSRLQLRIASAKWPKLACIRGSMDIAHTCPYISCHSLNQPSTWCSILFLDGSWRITTYFQISQIMWQPKRRIGIISREPFCKAEQQKRVQCLLGCPRICRLLFLIRLFTNILHWAIWLYYIPPLPLKLQLAIVGHWDLRNSSHIFACCCLEVNSSWNTFL